MCTSMLPRLNLTEDASNRIAYGDPVGRGTKGVSTYFFLKHCFSLTDWARCATPSDMPVLPEPIRNMYLLPLCNCPHTDMTRQQVACGCHSDVDMMLAIAALEVYCQPERKPAVRAARCPEADGTPEVKSKLFNLTA
ncbi:unnamed protein product [Effrenium voratum]|nr:unnamed protein product [Effrenium voratum]